MFTTALAILTVAASPASEPVLDGGGVGSASGGGTTGMQNERAIRDVGADMNRSVLEGAANYDISGLVTDEAGNPLGSIPVKLFVNGRLSSSALTAADGSFNVTTHEMEGAHTTTMLWFQSPDPEAMLDATAVLTRGTVVKEKGLVPPCTPELSFVGNTASIEVVMRNLDQTQAMFEESGCLEETAAP